MYRGDSILGESGKDSALLERGWSRAVCDSMLDKVLQSEIGRSGTCCEDSALPECGWSWVICDSILDDIPLVEVGRSEICWEGLILPEYGSILALPYPGRLNLSWALAASIRRTLGLPGALALP